MRDKTIRQNFFYVPRIARMGFEDNNLDNLFQQLATESTPSVATI